MFQFNIRYLASRFSWDVLCRNMDVARLLISSVGRGGQVLDAGCGNNSLAEHLRHYDMISLDLTIPSGLSEKGKFVQGSIIQLPFGDSSFSFSTSVDVLEHLPIELRNDAIRELVRVSDDGVILAFPNRRIGRFEDEKMFESLAKLNREAPSWLSEHMEHEYPDVTETISVIDEAILARSKFAVTHVVYSEDIRLTRLLRWLALRSTALYNTANVLLGLARRFIPNPQNEEGSYRSIIVTNFKPTKPNI